MKPIVTVPNQALVKPTKAVGVIDKRVQKMIVEMKQALSLADNPKGVGLAASQLGFNVRIFILWPDEKETMRAIINPTITEKSTEMVKGIPSSESRLEGCLSIPNVWGMVRRHKEVTMKFLDEKGTEKSEHFTGFPAIVVQHEVDHLDGILFTMRVVQQKGTLFEPHYDKDGKEKLSPIEI
jgi:peptide deformylase